jgi:putative membrane protein
VTAPALPHVAPQPAPEPPGGGQQAWRRLSGRMLLVNPVQELVRAIPVLVGALVAGSSTGRGALWSAVGAGITIGVGLLRWFTTSYRVTAEQVQIRRGLLRRQLLSVPLDRVRTVDLAAPLHFRVLGLVRLAIGTGMSDRKSDSDLRLNGLSTAEASRLRDELLDRRGPRRAPSARAEEVLAVAQPSWVRFGPFSLSGLLSVGVASTFAWRILSEFRVDPRRLEAAAGGRLSQVGAPRWIVLAAAPLLFLAIVTIASTARYVLSFWGFRLTRSAGAALQVTRGLLSTRAITIEERRLRGVEISEPLLLRAAKGARCIGIATGLRVGRGAERGGALLLPPAPREEARRVAAAVLRDPEPVTAPLVAHGSRARRRRYTRMLMVCGPLGAATVALWRVAALPDWTWAAALALFPVGAALAYDRYRSLGHALVEGTLVIGQGSLVRRRYMLEREGIIGWNLDRSFFQRRGGLVTLVATTAAGRQRYAVQDVGLDEAVHLADAALPGLLTPFLVAAESRPSG